MRYYEARSAQSPKLISEEKYSSVKFAFLRLCILIAILGIVVLFVAYAYRDFMGDRGVDYRRIQTYAILAIFGGWFLFLSLGSSMGVSMKKLTYSKVRSILRNEVETPFDMDLSIRKKISNSLNRLDDQWTLFSTVFGANPDRKVSMVLTGPGGVYAMNSVLSDPRKKDFVDPGFSLMAGKTALELKLNQTVMPVIIFRRHKKYYQPRSKDLKMFSFQELYAYLSNRNAVLDEAKLAEINRKLHELSGTDEDDRV